MLEAIFATLSLGGRRILDRVSVQINAGEVVALIGPNGAGKSTLLKVLSGELKAERGRVALHGCPLNAWKHRELARYRAVLPQGARLDFSFLVLEAVLLGRSPHLDGWETPEDYAIARAALAAATPYTSKRGGFRASRGESSSGCSSLGCWPRSGKRLCQARRAFCSSMSRPRRSTPRTNTSPWNSLGSLSASKGLASSPCYTTSISRASTRTAFCS